MVEARLTTYYLDNLAGGAGPGNRGADFAIFRTSPVTFQRISSHVAADRGEFKLYTSDWIKRGRPTQITIILPAEEDSGGDRG